jgi:hypothetical protein
MKTTKMTQTRMQVGRMTCRLRRRRLTWRRFRLPEDELAAGHAGGPSSTKVAHQVGNMRAHVIGASAMGSSAPLTSAGPARYATVVREGAATPVVSVDDHDPEHQRHPKPHSTTRLALGAVSVGQHLRPHLWFPRRKGNEWLPHLRLRRRQQSGPGYCEEVSTSPISITLDVTNLPQNFRS